MPQRITIPFVGGENKSRSVSVNNQQTVNFINAVKGQGAKSPVVLEPAPGLVDVGTAGNGICRSPSMVNWKGDLYGVFGDKLVKIDSLITITEIGTLSTVSGVVRIARGRDYIALVDGANGYTYDGTTFVAITDTDFPTEQTPAGTSTHILYLDGFFIVNNAVKDDFYISALEDPTSWNALDFEAAAVAPDNALAIAATESILYIMGDETTQMYYNDGDPDFPYQIYLNATQEVGIAAPQSVAESDDGIFFLGTTPEGGLFVYQIRGTEGAVISGDEQEDDLAAVADPTTAYGFIYKQDGKSFYVLQLDAGVRTLVYNIRADVWETRQLQDGTAWRAAGHGVVARRNIVGSRLAASIYELDLSVYTDAGEEMIRRRVSEVYHNHNHDMDWLQLVIELEPGVGTVSGAGSDPVCRMRYSDDGGKSWSDQLIAPIGKEGEHTRRVVYHALGQSRNRVIEVEFADPVNTTVIAAYAVLQMLND